MASIVKAIFHGRIERCDDSLPSVIFEDCLADILTEKPQVKSSTSPWQVECWKYLHANLSLIDLLYKMEMNIHTKENRWKVLHLYSLILTQSWIYMKHINFAE